MKILIKNKHWKLNEEYNIDKILYLLVDRPTCMYPYDYFHWKNNRNEWHRDYDLPHRIDKDGYVSFGTNNKFCRFPTKPARVWNNGKIEYWFDDRNIKRTTCY